MAAASTPITARGGHIRLVAARADDLHPLGLATRPLGRQHGRDGDAIDVDIRLGSNDVAHSDSRGKELPVENSLGVAGAGGAPGPGSVRALAGEFDGYAG